MKKSILFFVLLIFIVFIQVGFAQKTNGKSNKEKVLITDIDATKKAIYLPQPRVPFNVDFPQNSIVKVRVVIFLGTGIITEAKAVSGLQKLRPFAEEAAKCARFQPANYINVSAVAFITYKFDDSNKSNISEMNGGVLNGKAINLPKPIVPPDINASGTVSVRVWLDEEGNVIWAKAVSGNFCLGQAAVEAAKKAKFSKTFLSKQPVKVSGIIVYNFPPKEK